MTDIIEDNIFMANFMFMVEMAEQVKGLKEITDSPILINPIDHKQSGSISTEYLDNDLKSKILFYLNNLGVLISAAPGNNTDLVTGDTIPGTTIIVYSDGDYIWDCERILLFEKYDLRLSRDFIEHVLIRIN